MNTLISNTEELKEIALQVYLYLVKSGSAVGPRDVMRNVNLSSPSVAYRYLNKLVDLGLAEKDAYGNYVANSKLEVKGYLWFGRTLIPEFLVFSFFFLGLLIAELYVLVNIILGNQAVSSFLILLLLVTALSAALFMYEGLKLKRKLKN